MKNFCKLFLFLALISSIFAISACGKVSAPSPYEGSGYPHSYPRN